MTTQDPVGEQWRKGQRLSPPVGSSRDIYMYYIAGVGFSMEEEIGDIVLADHRKAAQVEALVQALTTIAEGGPYSNTGGPGFLARKTIANYREEVPDA